MSVSLVETNPVDFDDFEPLHRLLSTSFAYMEGRIDPPSSMSRLSVADVRHKCRTEDLFVIRTPTGPVACLFGAVRPDTYYIGKLAVAAAQRNRGLARALIEAAVAEARVHGLPTLELQTRVELVENHAAFLAMGFVQTGATEHDGYDRPTSLTFRRNL